MTHPVRYRLEALVAWLLLLVLRGLPLDWASAAGSLLGRLFGRFSGKSRIARLQVAAVMPERSAAETRRIVSGMWDNFGRTVAELTHLRTLQRPDVFERRVEIVGREHVTALADDERGALMFTGHLGNWELLTILTRHLGVPQYVVYRAANNPLVDRMITTQRRDAVLGHIPKGAQGARQLIKLLRQHQHVGTFVDQRMNDGIAVPFFGYPAMTAPAIAQLALAMDLPVVGGFCERLRGAHFRITITPPVQVERSGDRDADVLAFMSEINRTIESWVRRRPDQWLWIHRRWGKDFVRRGKPDQAPPGSALKSIR